MVVSMLKFIIEIPPISSIKEKRRIIGSLKDKIRIKFKVSAAEVDLQDSYRFAQFGVALVSNSRKYGESVMQKILHFVEANSPGRLNDAKIMSEIY